jgi:hypothetical protein
VVQVARTTLLTFALCGAAAAFACNRDPSPSPVPEASASVSPEASAVPVAPASVTIEAQAPTPAPPPQVTVENIGMHIGGGPNDAPTKAPIAGSVSPHFTELGACWSQVADATKAGDFGVDLLIPRDGGLASVSHPRTALGPDAFRDCVVGVFSRIEFARPLTGRTTVSYSLRFTPGVRPAQ